MVVRCATLTDVEELNLLYQHFFTHNASQQPAYYKVAIESGRYPKYVIESPQEELFVAVENEKLVGFIHVSEDKTPPFDCYVPHRFAVGVDLYIVPDCRKRGIGTKLIDTAKQWAKG